MFNLQGSEIIFILLLALVVLGPEKLPGAIRRATKTYAELRKMGDSFQSEFKSVLDEPLRELRDTANLIKDQADPKKVAEAAEREAADKAKAQAASAVQNGSVAAQATATDAAPAAPKIDYFAATLKPSNAAELSTPTSDDESAEQSAPVVSDTDQSAVGADARTVDAPTDEHERPDATSFADVVEPAFADVVEPAPENSDIDDEEGLRKASV